MSALGLAALIINSVLTCCCALPHWLLEFCIHCLISLCSFHLLLFSPFEYIESLRLPRCFTSWGKYVKSSGLQAICCCDIAAPAFLVLPQSLCSCPAWALSAVLQCAKLFLVPFLVCQNIFASLWRQILGVTCSYQFPECHWFWVNITVWPELCDSLLDNLCSVFSSEI